MMHDAMSTKLVAQYDLGLHILVELYVKNPVFC